MTEVAWCLEGVSGALNKQWASGLDAAQMRIALVCTREKTTNAEIHVKKKRDNLTSEASRTL